MRRKLSIHPKVTLAGNADEDIFLETSEADLFSRWRKEIRSCSRKDRHAREVKVIVDVAKS